MKKLDALYSGHRSTLSLFYYHRELSRIMETGPQSPGRANNLGLVLDKFHVKSRINVVLRIVDSDRRAYVLTNTYGMKFRKFHRLAMAKQLVK